MSQAGPGNRLAGELSPYLLQHADNPVHWQPWGAPAFERARREDKPIFLSIGYSACHWCHVMERESFADAEIARLLNEGYVSIKVDREERPDVDHIYMKSCQLMTGGGGWPLTIVMTPDRQPFYAATYLPRDSRHGRPGLLELLPRISSDWRHDRGALVRLSDRVRSELAATDDRGAGGAPGAEVLELGYRQLAAVFDQRHGGFGGGIKFPMPHQLLFLLRYWRRSGNDYALAMVDQTLTAMRRGGIYDHVGFGFHRYSTDPAWHVPHFEKMLYDQALLLLAYTEGFQATGRPEHGRTAREIASYVLGRLTDHAGGFWSAEDADSEGIEGAFYRWDEATLRELLDPESAELVIDAFGVSAAGNIRFGAGGAELGGNVLHQRGSLAEIAARVGSSEGEVRGRLASARQVLRRARDRRPRPGCDDKVLTDWNGLMFGALARAARVFEEPGFARAAERAAGFVLDRMGGASGALLHRYRRGVAGIPGGLDDYAFTVFGLLELYETTLEPALLAAANVLQEEQEQRFADPRGGGYFLTQAVDRELIVRAKVFEDGALPAGNSIAFGNLLRLAGLTGDATFERRAAELARGYGDRVARAPSAFGMFLAELEASTTLPGADAGRGSFACDREGTRS